LTSLSTLFLLIISRILEIELSEKESIITGIADDFVEVGIAGLISLATRGGPTEFITDGLIIGPTGFGGKIPEEGATEFGSTDFVDVGTAGLISLATRGGPDGLIIGPTGFGGKIPEEGVTELGFGVDFRIDKISSNFFDRSPDERALATSDFDSDFCCKTLVKFSRETERLFNASKRSLSIKIT
jgi:hypothetical protein